MMVRLLGDY